MMKKKHKKKGQKGFTLIELVLVITVLGILAVAALPSFINVAQQARNASRDGVVGAVRSGLAMFRANDLANNGPPGIYPATLDVAVAGAAAPANLLFTGPAACPANIAACPLLQQGISDAAWSKTDDTTYTFTSAPGAVFTYTYDPATGSFTSPTAP